MTQLAAAASASAPWRPVDEFNGGAPLEKTVTSLLNGGTRKKDVFHPLPFMPKILCIFSLVVSSILFLLFLADLIAGIPFGGTGGAMLNIGFVVGAGIVAAMSVLTFLEQR